MLAPRLGLPSAARPALVSSLLVASVLATACTRRAPAAAAGEPVAIALAVGFAHPGIQALTPIAEARDVASAGERIAVASGGGVLEYAGGRFVRAVTWADGLGDVEATAVSGLADGRLAAGGADGSVTLLGGPVAQVARFGGGAVADLAFDGHQLFVATRAGVYAWTPGAAAARRFVAGEDVTTLASGPAGVAVGTANGHVLALTPDGGLRVLDVAKERVTALAWDGPALWIGRPGGLDRRGPGGQVERVRRDISVTALLRADDGTLLVGTPEDGVVTIETGGVERRLLGGAQVARLRRIGGRTVAVADAAVYALPDGSPLVPAPPPGLAGGPVTALAIAADALWAGTAVGVDVFDLQGIFRRHVGAREAVHSLLVRPELGEVVVGTSQGAIVVGPDGGERRVGALEGLLGLRVQASAWLVDTAAYATDQGVTLIDGRGVVRRLPGAAAAVAWGDGGRLYVGTSEGLAVVGDSDVTHPLADGAVVALALGAEGMYAASARGLVLVTPSGAVERLGSDEAVNVGALAVETTAAGERIYAGSPKRGLLVYERGARAWHTVRAPLPSGNVTAVAPAADGVWLGTEAGVIRVARDVLERALAPARS